MILLVDNYDSFTYNLEQLLAPTMETIVLRNDDPRIFQTAGEACGIVFSPGPGRPQQAGLMELLIKQFYQTKPMLGICLGHQALGEVFGARVIRAEQIRHGKESTIEHTGKGLFQDLEPELSVMRYHSLVLDNAQLPQDFTITAIAKDDHEVMAMAHKELPLYGVQFHPESIGTPSGARIIQNFLQIVQERRYQYEAIAKNV